MEALTLIVLVLVSFSHAATTAEQVQQVRGREEELKNRRTVIEVKGGPDSVVWAVQLSDLNFSVHHPQRALSFSQFVGPALSLINPSLVLVTGDLTGLSISL